MPVTIRPVSSSDAAAFVAAARASRALHRPWVTAPATGAQFDAYLSRFSPPSHYGFVVCEGDDERLAGAINLTNIVYGSFRSGYLGYFAFAGHERQGCMAIGLRGVLRVAFRELGLHRVEANIQPGNLASIALVRACGFVREGYSKGYLKIGGRWRDHERWARVR
jgi:ribosomal-protein-alanine N-acetyltransferase